MTWNPGPRPAWVQHAIDGEGGPVYDRAKVPFDVDELVAEARLRAGTDDLDGDSFREPLEVFTRSLDEEADLHVVGRWRVREVILRGLENRLRITEAVRRDPDITDESIVQPLIVCGSPRAGTSLLHQLLALDPAARAPLAWEYWCPAPPPLGIGITDDPRIALADRDVRLSAALEPGFDGIHQQGALLPREDASSMIVDFRSDVLGAHYPVPAYRAWFDAADLQSGYRWFRRTLQVLQRGTEPRRWVLKQPGHMAVLPTLLATYPDAHIVVCHRDPLEMLSSVTSLLATLQWAHSNAVDYPALARQQADYYHRVLTRLVGFCRDGIVDPARLAHVHFARLNDEPAETVRSIYERFGQPTPGDQPEQIADLLAARPRGRLGGHDHSWDDLGLDLDAERSRFAEYQEFFGVPSESVA
jgi:Sulfotransferase family